MGRGVEGVSWEPSAPGCHVGGLPLFIAPSSHLVIQSFFLHIPTENKKLKVFRMCLGGWMDLGYPCSLHPLLFTKEWPDVILPRNQGTSVGKEDHPVGTW